MNDASPRPLRRKLAAVLGFGCLAVASVGMLLRLTLRDRVPYIAAAYYATPLPVLLAFAALATWTLRKRRRAFLAAATLTGVMLVWWGVAHWSFRSPQASKNSLRIAFWNVARGVGGWDAIAAQLRDEEPDIIGLVESGRPKEMQPYWNSAFPDRTSLALRGGMMIAVKGEIVSSTLHTLDYRATANRVEVRCRDRDWVIWIVDIYSVPTVFRGPPLEWLAARVADDAGRATVIMGDFNTPTDSVHLAGLRGLFRNAFETAGNGYAATWPQPVPVLTLDQVWVSDSVQVLNCRHRLNRLSDHRRVVVELDAVAR